jgi:hypothetical protein
VTLALVQAVVERCEGVRVKHGASPLWVLVAARLECNPMFYRCQRLFLWVCVGSVWARCGHRGLMLYATCG